MSARFSRGFPSFPNSLWERDCLRNSIASVAFAGSAMELPRQVRSQMEFGNEGKAEAAPSPGGRRLTGAGGFTLLEMMITLTVFVLLAAAVFGILTGVLQSTSTLQDNQDRRDQVAALNAFLKKKLGEMPAAGTLGSYQRGNGEGLAQNGILFGTRNFATVIDADLQANGYYALRLTTFTTEAGSNQPQDARQVLLQAVTTNDPTLVWTPLMGDIKILDWKFLDFNSTVWVDLWNGSNKPNLVEFSMQPAGDLQPTTMDFWVPKIEPVTVNAQPQPASH